MWVYSERIDGLYGIYNLWCKSWWEVGRYRSVDGGRGIAMTHINAAPYIEHCVLIQFAVHWIVNDFYFEL